MAGGPYSGGDRLTAPPYHIPRLRAGDRSKYLHAASVEVRKPAFHVKVWVFKRRYKFGSNIGERALTFTTNNKLSVSIQQLCLVESVAQRLRHWTLNRTVFCCINLWRVRSLYVSRNVFICTNEYLAIDSGRYLCMDNLLCEAIAAWTHFKEKLRWCPIQQV